MSEQNRLHAWQQTHLLPLENLLLQRENQGPAERAQNLADLADLAALARREGVYGRFYPPALGGQCSSLSAYLPLAVQEGYSEFGAYVFGAENTLDLHMLCRYAPADLQARYLAPIAAGASMASYAMSEPDAPGSNPALLQSRAHLGQDGYWQINAHKWFICRAAHAALFTVLVQSSDEAGGRGLSMLLVPADTPGVQVVRELAVLGRHMGQAEVRMQEVRIPAHYVLGQMHQGRQLLPLRLSLGRILRSAQWLGLAQRCFDLMCARLRSPRAASYADTQLVRLRVAQSWRALAAARALLQAAAAALPQPASHVGAEAMLAIDCAKLAASDALCACAEHAVQIYGAEGLSDLHPLGAIWRLARSTRMMDGVDDALMNALGKRLLQKWDGITLAEPAHVSPA